MANYLCSENVCGKNVCGKETYCENPGHNSKQLITFDGYLDPGNPRQGGTEMDLFKMFAMLMMFPVEGLGADQNGYSWLHWFPLNLFCQNMGYNEGHGNTYTWSLRIRARQPDQGG